MSKSKILKLFPGTKNEDFRRLIEKSINGETKRKAIIHILVKENKKRLLENAINQQPLLKHWKKDQLKKMVGKYLKTKRLILDEGSPSLYVMSNEFNNFIRAIGGVQKTADIYEHLGQPYREFHKVLIDPMRRSMDKICSLVNKNGGLFVGGASKTVKRLARKSFEKHRDPSKPDRQIKPIELYTKTQNFRDLKTIQPEQKESEMDKKVRKYLIKVRVKAKRLKLANQYINTGAIEFGRKRGRPKKKRGLIKLALKPKVPKKKDKKICKEKYNKLLSSKILRKTREYIKNPKEQLYKNKLMLFKIGFKKAYPNEYKKTYRNIKNCDSSLKKEHLKLIKQVQKHYTKIWFHKLIKERYKKQFPSKRRIGLHRRGWPNKTTLNPILEKYMNDNLLGDKDIWPKSKMTSKQMKKANKKLVATLLLKSTLSSKKEVKKEARKISKNVRASKIRSDKLPILPKPIKKHMKSKLIKPEKLDPVELLIKQKATRLIKKGKKYRKKHGFIKSNARLFDKLYRKMFNKHSSSYDPISKNRTVYNMWLRAMPRPPESKKDVKDAIKRALKKTRARRKGSVIQPAIHIKRRPAKFKKFDKLVKKKSPVELKRLGRTVKRGKQEEDDEYDSETGRVILSPKSVKNLDRLLVESSDEGSLFGDLEPDLTELVPMKRHMNIRKIIDSDEEGSDMDIELPIPPILTPTEDIPVWQMVRDDSDDHGVDADGVPIWKLLKDDHDRKEKEDEEEEEYLDSDDDSEDIPLSQLFREQEEKAETIPFLELPTAGEGMFMGSQLNSTAKLMARFANASYTNKEKRKNIKEWSYFRPYSSRMIAVYKNNSGDMILAVKGTNSKKEIITDIKLIFANFKKDKIFKKTSKKLNNIINQNQSTRKFYLTGHSLGGSIVLWYGSKSKIETYAFNPGITPNFLRSVNINKPNIHIIVRKGDPISNGILLYKNKLNKAHLTILNSKSLNPLINHSIKSMLKGGDGCCGDKLAKYDKNNTNQSQKCIGPCIVIGKSNPVCYDKDESMVYSIEKNPHCKSKCLGREVTSSNLKIIPKINERECILISGPSGVGKTYMAMDYVRQFKKIKPKHNILLYSKKPFENLGLKYKHMNESIKAVSDMKLPDIKNSLVIFDDYENISDSKDGTKAIESLLNNILNVGRTFDIYCIVITHVMMNYRLTKNILNECNKIILFPNGGNKYQYKKYLQTYMGLGKDQIEQILRMKDRHVVINKTFPTHLLSKTKLKLI